MRQILALPTEQDKLANTDYAMTLEEIGQIEGVTREYVRQVQNKALLKLKKRFPAILFLMRDMAIELRHNRDSASYGVIR